MEFLNATFANAGPPVQGAGGGRPTVYINMSAYNIANLIMIVVGLVGNTLILVVMCNKMFDKTSTSLYLSVLAISDSLVLIAGPFAAVTPRMFKFDIRSLHLSLCWIMKFLIYWARHLSSFCLMGITLERLIVILKPHRTKHLMTRRSAAIFVITSAVILALPNIRVFVMFDINYRPAIPVCLVHDPKYEMWVLHIVPYIDLFFYTILPSGVIIVSNTVIVYTLTRNKTKMVGNTGQTTVQRSIHKIVPMLLLVSTTFVICTMPPCVYMVVRGIRGIKPGEWTLGWAAVTWMSSFNHSINFFLYLISGQQFRQKFLAIVCCIKEKQEVHVATAFSSLTPPHSIKRHE